MKNWAGIGVVLAAITLGVGWASLRTDADAKPAGTGGGSTTTQCSITINGGTNTEAMNANHVCETSTPAASASAASASAASASAASASPVPPSRVPAEPPAATAKDTGAAPPNVPADIPVPARPARQSHPAPPAPSPTRSPSSTLSYGGGQLEIALIDGGASKVATQSEADLQLYPAELAPLATWAARANPDNTCPTLTGENTAGMNFDVQDRPLFCVKSRAGDHYRVRIEPANSSADRPFPYTISVVMVAAA